MLSFIDQISAMLIVGVVAVVYVATSAAVQRLSVEQTFNYQMKTETLSFGEVLEKDVLKMGAGTLNGEDLISMSTYTTLMRGLSGTTFNMTMTDSLSFWIYDDSTAADVRIDYVLTPVDTLVYPDSSMNTLYELIRYANGNYSGSSAPTLRSFETELLDSDGNDVGLNVDDARLIRLAFINTSPYANNSNFNLKDTIWSMTLSPKNLN